MAGTAGTTEAPQSNAATGSAGRAGTDEVHATGTAGTAVPDKGISAGSAGRASEGIRNLGHAGVTAVPAIAEEGISAGAASLCGAGTTGASVTEQPRVRAGQPRSGSCIPAVAGYQPSMSGGTARRSAATVPSVAEEHSVAAGPSGPGTVSVTTGSAVAVQQSAHTAGAAGRTGAPRTAGPAVAD
ncbi:hypothetical protein MSIMFB_05730 [Mycobacterium simulans]|uniref:Uncharacterized protein n=1 Tax=Mycobacterium simulans TaxID=627089 RepID=A0A7Z7NDR1_9MYCO|nr:hypothetical protein MSIMFB_05730 [Mycobacterium simulans]